MEPKLNTEISRFRIGDYELDADRHYSRDNHMWVVAIKPTRVRCGFDPLGSETSGDIVAVSFEPVGSKLRRGEPFGQLEAAKFVGPLVAPVSGTIARHNSEVLANPSSINTHPLDSWLIELESISMEADLATLLHGREALDQWFTSEIERFLSQGMIAQ